MEFLKLIDELSEQIYITDAENYTLLYMNKSAKEHFNSHKTENCKCHELFYCKDKPCYFCPVTHLDYENYTEWNCRNSKIKSKLLDYNGRKCIISIISSASESDFLEKLSRQVRTPMNAVVGLTHIAKNSIGFNSKVVDCLNKIELSSQHLLSLINNNLDIYRIKNSAIEVKGTPFDLNSLINDLGSLISKYSGNKKITFSFKRDFQDSLLLGDEIRINQIILNIIDNVIKHTSSSGKITVSIRQKEAKDSSLAKIKFSVKAQNTDISASNLNMIFDSYESEKNLSATLESNFAISHALLYLMDSKLNAKIKDANTVSFYFTIDFKKQYSVKTESDDAENNESSGTYNYDFSNRKLLLVEDNKMNADIARSILEMASFSVDTVYNGKEALDKYLGTSPYYYDCIIMDIRMPVMDGLEATKRIRSSNKEDSETIPIIAISANAFEEDTKKSIESGMNGHLTKPINVKKLFRLLKQLL